MVFCMMAAAGLTAPQDPLPADTGAIRLVLEQYLAAHASGDAASLAALWHPSSPRAAIENAVAEAQFKTQGFSFSGLRVVRWSVTGDETTALVSVDARTVDRKTERTTDSNWLRYFTFRRLEGAWRIWQTTSAVDDLATALDRAATDEERIVLLDADPDLVSEALRAAVSRKASAAYAKRDNARALSLMRLAVTIAERTGEPVSVGRARLDIALVHQATGDLARAAASFENALEAFRAAGDTPSVADIEMNLAGIRYRQASFEQKEKARLAIYAEAQGHYKRALEGYEAAGETGWHASILHSLGNTSYLLGQWDAALDYYRKTLAIQEAALAEAGEKRTLLQIRGVAAANQAIGMVLEEQADYPAALEALGRSLSHFESFDDKSGMANVRAEIGKVCRLTGDFTQAIRHFLSALEIAGQMRADAKDPANEGKLLAEIGEAYGLEQRYVVALDYFNRSLEKFERAGSKESVATVLGGIGGVHFLNGSFDLALESFRKSLALRDELEDDKGAALTLAQVSLVLTAREELPEARDACRQSLERATASSDKRTIGIALALSASAATALGETDEGLDLAGRASRLATEIDDLDIAIRARLAEGEARRVRGEVDLAEARTRESIELVERVRAAGIRSDERFFNDTVAAYMALVHLLVLQERTGEAFAVLERARQFRMRDLLGGALVVKGLTAEERVEEQRLRKRVGSLRAQTRKARQHREPDPARIEELSKEFETAAADLRSFEESLYGRHPDLEMLRAVGAPVDLDAGASDVLGETTALMAYAVTETATYLFVATPARKPSAEPNPDSPNPPGDQPVEEGAAPVDLSVASIDISPLELAQRVTELNRLIAERHEDAAAKAAEMHSLLVAPAASRVAGMRRLLIVPDAALWALPFQALRSGAGRYLVEDAAVGYGASFTALATSARVGANLNATSASGRVPLLAVGFAEPGPAAKHHFGLVRPDTKFEPMPNAEKEALALGKGAPAAGAGILVGPGATVAAVQAAARQADVLHLALPALLQDAGPLHSVLVFAEPEDGSLSERVTETADLMSWEVPARAVVMSRVHGDPGRQSAGAAARALAWAWLVAGVPATVMTRWAVDAPSSIEIAGRLHRGLARTEAGKPASQPMRASEALREAILPLLDGPNAHPYYWAGYTAIGDGGGRR